MYEAWCGEDRGMFAPRDFRCFTPFALIDLPVAIVFDTVTLPYDAYLYSHNRRAASFWKQAFETGVLPADKSSDSYFAKGEWLDQIIFNGIQGTPPPSKEVIDYIIDLSFKHGHSVYWWSYYSPLKSLACYQSLSTEQAERIYLWAADQLERVPVFSTQTLLELLLALPAMTDAFLDELGQSTNEWVLMSLLQSKRTSLTVKTDLISRLLDSPNWKARLMVAANPHVTPDQLMRLASDRNSEVSKRALSNASATEDVLWEFAKNGDRIVRHWVVRHPKATDEMIDYCRQQTE